MGETNTGGDMKIEAVGPGGGLNYEHWRLGGSRIQFRGPRPRLDGPQLACLGGTETYGRYVPVPYPALVGRQLGVGVLNLGCVNAGPDVYLGDPAALDLASSAAQVVVQLTGAHLLSNRFYTVHPRRNDRFLRASSLMGQVFRDVDFTEFSFTRHMLESLHRFAPERFSLVLNEIQTAWVARMRLLLARFEGRAALLWVQGAGAAGALGPEPLFVTENMVAQLADRASQVVQVRISDAALARGSTDMIHGPAEAAAAAGLPNPAAHEEVATALARALVDIG